MSRILNGARCRHRAAGPCRRAAGHSESTARPGLATRKIVSAAYSAETAQGLISVAGIDHDVVVELRQHVKQFLDRAGVLRVGAIPTARNPRGCRAPTCDAPSARAGSPCRAGAGSRSRPGPVNRGLYAEEQRDLSQRGFQVDDRRRPLGEPCELDRAVHRHRRGACAPFGAQEHVGRAWLSRAGRRRFPSCRGATDSAVERLFHHPARRLRSPAGNPREESA